MGVCVCVCGGGWTCVAGQGHCPASELPVAVQGRHGRSWRGRTALMTAAYSGQCATLAPLLLAGDSGPITFQPHPPHRNCHHVGHDLDATARVYSLSAFQFAILVAFLQSAGPRG